MDRIDKYILRFTDKVDHSKTTNSRYYDVNKHVLRVSDHIALSAKCAEWSIILDSANPKNYILYSPKTYHLSVLSYDEAKAFVKTWVLMSKTACNRTASINDSDTLMHLIKSLFDKIQAKEQKADSINKVIDLTKLTQTQIKKVQTMILDNMLSFNNIKDTLAKEPDLESISLSSFTKSQQSAIMQFLKQNANITK